VIDNDGNIGDACVLSVMATLASYKRPIVAAEFMQNEEVKIKMHSERDIEPASLTLHHLPISISFAS